MKLKLYACLVVGVHWSLPRKPWQTRSPILFSPSTSTGKTVLLVLLGSLRPDTSPGRSSAALTRSTGPMIRPLIGLPMAVRSASGLTKTFATTQGNITATVFGVSYNGTTLADNRAARNRGANGQAQGSMYQDFIFSQINNQASGA